jgi:hypothetical protein
MKRSALFPRRQHQPQHQHMKMFSPGYCYTSRQHDGSRSLLLLSHVARFLLWLFFLGAVGVVSPFAGGSTADVGGGTNSVRSKESVAHQLYPIPQHAIAATTTTSTTTQQRTNRATHSPLFRSSSSALSPLAAAESSMGTIPPSSPPAQPSTLTSTQTKQSRSLCRRIFWNLNPLPGRKNHRWKGGESQATLASRLLFSYVTPLLDVAANRTLTENDALSVSEQLQMNVAVPKLADAYDKARRKARHTLETTRRRRRRRFNGTNNNDSHNRHDSNIVKKKKNSQTWILLQTLFQYQQSPLLFTGCLRLVNTAIQAFPAIIVARLLRSIEAGTTEPVSKSVRAALLLVGVLSVKMIVENQMFHHVVTMSTQVRGALEGLIFDKSLRLPEGGRGVMARQNLSTEKKALGSGGVRHLWCSGCHCVFVCIGRHVFGKYSSNAAWNLCLVTYRF